MIHVCFGLHDGNGRYSKFVGTTMASIFENTLAPVTIHILHDDTLTADNRDKFSYLVGRHGQQVKFHNVEKICADEINFLREKLADKIKLRFSIGAFYRLLMKKILAPLQIGKAIYLDADIIVNLDIDELWRQDLKNFPLAAVPEIDATLNNMVPKKFLIDAKIVNREDYFCSGVIVFNLDALDENFFLDGVQFLVDNPKCESPDQDILNAFFSTNYLKLEQKFDSFVLCCKWEEQPVENRIYHYAGQLVRFDSYNDYDRLWLEHFLKTPWFGVEIFGKLDKEFAQIRLEFLQKAKKTLTFISTVMSGKTRAFFIMPGDAKFLKEYFLIRDDEEIIFANEKDSVPNLVYSMAKAQGKKIFIIVVPKFQPLSELLKQLDFAPERDFINGEIFLVREEDNKFDSFQLIEAM